MPIITNDDPPMNEVAADGLNAILVGSWPEGTAKSGIPAMTPDVDEMTAAIERIADDELRARLSEGAVEVRERRSVVAHARRPLEALRPRRGRSGRGRRG